MAYIVNSPYLKFVSLDALLNIKKEEVIPSKDLTLT